MELAVQQSATDDDELDALRAVLAAAWWAADRGRPVARVTGEEAPTLVRPGG